MAAASGRRCPAGPRWPVAGSCFALRRASTAVRQSDGSSQHERRHAQKNEAKSTTRVDHVLKNFDGLCTSIRCAHLSADTSADDREVARRKLDLECGALERECTALLDLVDASHQRREARTDLKPAMINHLALCLRSLGVSNQGHHQQQLLDEISTCELEQKLRAVVQLVDAQARCEVPAMNRMQLTQFTQAWCALGWADRELLSSIADRASELSCANTAAHKMKVSDLASLAWSFATSAHPQLVLELLLERRADLEKELLSSTATARELSMLHQVCHGWRAT